ncbi:MAG TPA: glutathione peroxidase [Gammaproteobacteria bacterium]|nr:glutathione peroxidase [Gammaproteobacteria bacterium]
MKKILIFLLGFYLSSCLLANCPDVLDHEVRLLDSKETINLCEYKDKVVLAVNVASRCGYTPQYEGLQNLYKDLEDKDFVILAFPSRDFMWQEFSDESKIKEFCDTKYGVTFPMFATSSVKGKKANNFFKGLIKKTGIEPEWNFNKYLISRNGEVKHFNQSVEPDDSELVKSIKILL